MATSTTLILIVGMAVVTYLTRLPLALLSRTRSKLPKVLDRVLEQIPVAAFAAIVFPSVLQPNGHTETGPPTRTCGRRWWRSGCR